ncbi:MAG: putative cardiolipin synthase YbhO [Pseudomonadota bacterium]|jgi:cardiolipin synthase
MTGQAHRLQTQQVRLLEGGRAYFNALVEAMGQAREHILLETYILDFAGDAERVVLAMMAAARRGVQVWLVMDGVGTGALPANWAARLDAAGVQWRLYAPLGRLGLLLPSRWRRLHRKLCVIDEHTAFCGGINILDDWLDPRHGPLAHPRLDYAVQVQGPLVLAIREAMTQLWWRLQAVRQVRQRDFPRALRAWRQSSPLQRLEAASPLARGELRPGRAMLLLRDNLRHRHRIERAYRRAIAQARDEIVLANAYFLPGWRLRQALIAAARRGVRVRLLLQGRYEYFMQYHAARPVYGPLLAAGVEIHEFEPSFLHAKVAVVDPGRERCWATVGSSNLDPLSLLLAREANLVVADRAFAGELCLRLEQVIATQSRPVRLEDIARRPWTQRLQDRVALGLMRLALFLTGHRY